MVKDSSQVYGNERRYISSIQLQEYIKRIERYLYFYALYVPN